jgi:transcriptional regulator with XRE-family HTH domain
VIEPFYGRMGARMRKARIAEGRTQAWLSNRMGWTRASVANIECGKQRILAHQLPKLARLLETSTDYLLGELR